MKAEIQGFIKEHVESYKRRTNSRTDWGEPVVAFAEAQDPLFCKMKGVVGPSHLLPSDLLPDAKSVITYFIPFSRETVGSNAAAKGTSKKWAQSYIETNQLIVDLNNALSDMLKKKGFRSATTPPAHNFDQEKLVSNWSQKHVAYIAGLGKFGLHHMIITEKGCCGRIGSLVTNAKIEPTKKVHTEFCLFKLNGSCGVCVEKCRPKALKTDHLDKQTCYKECLRNAKIYTEMGLADVCGKCIVMVPCSFMNPAKS